MSGPYQSSAKPFALWAPSGTAMTPPAKTYAFEELVVGQSASRTRTITAADIVAFADVCHDHNPVHLDAAYAATTIFKERVAHGMLSAGIMSGLFGEQLPGPGAIYVAQSLKFRAPVKIGDTLVARVEVLNKMPGGNLVVFKTECRVGDKVVVEGEATMLVARHPKD
jgi:3-hydroxybutyryl-CoA dehydratase